MKKSTLLISFILLFVVVSFAIFLGVTIKRWRKNPPLWYYRQFTLKPLELPARLIRPAFRGIAGQELPKRADGLRAIFEGGRDPSVFVRFETDTEGIDYIKRVFNKPGSRSTYYDTDTFKELKMSGVSFFSVVSQWQDEIGICIFDLESIESGLEIYSASGPGAPDQQYHIFIDDKRNIVYIRAVYL